MQLKRGPIRQFACASLLCVALAPGTGASALTLGAAYALDAPAHTLGTGATQRAISEEMVTLDPAGPASYTGSPITPSVRVVYGSNELEYGRDYVVSYERNVDVGTARVTVEGRGDWTGRARKSFAIRPVDLSGAQVVFASVPCPFVEGAEFDPPMQVTVGTLLLTRDRDYRLSAVLAGGNEAVVTVTGMGNYTGTKTAFVAATAGVAVTFVDGSTQELLSSEVVAQGGAAKAPVPPVHAGEIFAGWSKPYTNLHETTVVQAEYLAVEGEPRALAPKAGDNASARRITLSDGSEATLLNDEGSVLSHGWRIAGGLVFFADTHGLASSGVVEDGGKRYFVGPDGTRQTGWVSDPATGARLYAHPEDGSLACDEWFNDGYGWYYANADSTMRTGWMYRDGNWYWLNTQEGFSFARMAFGWTFIDGAWYWFDESGAMGKDRWVWWNTAWYWLLSDGRMAQNRWVLVRNWFYFLDGGAQATGWTWVRDGWYYLSVNDGMLTSTWTPDGCYVGADGRWAG